MTKKKEKDSLWDDRIHTPTRTIFLGGNLSSREEEVGEIDSHTADHICRSMHLLEFMDSKSLINVKFVSFGGSYEPGVTIYDAIKYSTCPVSMLVEGYCMSMGVMIFQAACDRVMKPHSRLMLHFGQLLIHATSYAERDAEYKYHLETDKEYIDLIAGRSGQSYQKIRALIDQNRYIGAEEAIALNLADRIYKPDKSSYILHLDNTEEIEPSTKKKLAKKSTKKKAIKKVNK